MLASIEEFVTGSVAVRADDRVLATVMFTDVVGSTEQLVERGDRRWQELLDSHDRVVRAEIERFRGREINTMGDPNGASCPTTMGTTCPLRARSAAHPGVR